MFRYSRLGLQCRSPTKISGSNWQHTSATRNRSTPKKLSLLSDLPTDLYPLSGRMIRALLTVKGSIWKMIMFPRRPSWKSPFDQPCQIQPLLGLSEGCSLTLDTPVQDAPAKSGVVVEHFDLPEDKLPRRDQRIYAQLVVHESVNWHRNGTRSPPAGLILAPNGTVCWKRVGVFCPDFRKSMSRPDRSHDAAAIIAELAPRASQHFLIRGH
ncbi:hypothetical protein BJ166DRAFT_539106, partial [Pestalotiopsis sp. NC0098]